MKIREAIKELSQYDPDESIVIAWWNKNDLGMEKMSTEAWDKSTSNTDSNMDWSGVYEELSWHMES